MRPLIFVVDGVAARCALARSTLEQAGYAVASFATVQVLELAEQQIPVLLLIAAALPDGSGIELCRAVRKHPTLNGTRIILVADSPETKYRPVAESGADDLISSQFTAGQLLSCVHALLHRYVPLAASVRVAKEAEIVIDALAMRVKVQGNEVSTTTLEFRLIDYMARHRGKVFTRDALLDAVWGDLQFVTPRSVDACIGRIRRKIERNRSAPSFLKTIRGIGYKLDATTAWEAASSELCQCPSCSMLRAQSRTTTRMPQVNLSPRLNRHG